MLVVEKGEPAVLIRHNQAKKKQRRRQLVVTPLFTTLITMAKVRVEESAI